MIRTKIHKSMVVALLGVLAAGCLWQCQWRSLKINVRFDQALGLAREDRVLFEAQTAGKVEAVEAQPDGSCLARLTIDQKHISAATEYAQFYLVDDPGRDGRKAVEIRLSRRDGKALADGATVTGVSSAQELTEQLGRQLKEGADYVKKRLEALGRDLQQFPESEEYKRIKKFLQDLADEIGRSEQQARQKLKDEWLPRLERELDRLKEKLRDSGREHETRPLEKEVERLRGI